MIVDVALPIPINKTFSYSVPDRWKSGVRNYLRVRVPFRNKVQTGIITCVHDEDNPAYKEIDEVVDAFPVVDGTLVELGLWASRYYVTPAGLVFKYVLPSTVNIEPYIVLKAQGAEPVSVDNLTLKKAIGLYGREAIFQYHEAGYITFMNLFTGKPFEPIVPPFSPGGESEKVLLIGDVRQRADYYGEMIAGAVGTGSNVLMLLPDHYASGAYFKKMFARRFGEKVLWYGTGTSGRVRMETFFKSREAGGSLILGNKSCTFLPVRDLSLIIVERPEEDEYRNEEAFKFNASLVALKRADIAGIPVVMGSSSPSMEMYHYARSNHFDIRERAWLLNASWQERMAMPDLFSSRIFLEELMPMVQESVDKGERMAIFTPRKDYGSYLVCHSCKKPLLCPVCDGVLGYQKEAGLLICTVCGKDFHYKEQCAHCGSSIIRFARIGAEHIEEKLREAFPHINMLRITGDSLKKEIKKVGKAPENEACILIGTQSLSKLYGFHTEKLILFGWEALRRMGGYRSDEKMIQILVNLMDALTPEKIVFLMERKNRVSIDRYVGMSDYYDEELKKRKEAAFPPYERVFLVEIRNKNKSEGERTIEAIRDILRGEGIEAALSGILRENKAKYGWRMILKSNDAKLPEILLRIYDMRGVYVEADPLNF